MYAAKGAAAAGASLAFLMLAVPAIASTRESPPDYTFKLDVAMAMRHFPRLHFHMQGVGVYEPGVSDIVHFTSLPWQLHAIDDPSLRNANVTLGPGGLARHVEATYSDGTTIGAPISRTTALTPRQNRIRCRGEQPRAADVRAVPRRRTAA